LPGVDVRVSQQDGSERDGTRAGEPTSALGQTSRLSGTHSRSPCFPATARFLSLLPPFPTGLKCSVAFP
jgi:hypothetical protein